MVTGGGSSGVVNDIENGVNGETVSEGDNQARQPKAKQ